MTSNCREVSGATSVFCGPILRKGTNILLVKGTLHAGMKETCAKTTMITSASFDIGCLKDIPEEEDDDDKLTIQPLSVSKSKDVF